jgi:hypothetical protein
MITDAPPRNTNRSGFLESDRVKTLDLPQNGCLLTIAKSIESAMKAGKSADARCACAEFLAETSVFYRTSTCGVRVLAARPLRVREHWATELFGDYNPQTMLIRLWMRTAVRKEITSYGTFLSTLCHEFCHHLDFQQFGFPDSWHTRGFFERTPRSTTMREERRRNDFSGCQYRAGAGGLTGGVQIGVGESTYRFDGSSARASIGMWRPAAVSESCNRSATHGITKLGYVSKLYGSLCPVGLVRRTIPALSRRRLPIFSGQR